MSTLAEECLRHLLFYDPVSKSCYVEVMSWPDLLTSNTENIVCHSHRLSPKLCWFSSLLLQSCLCFHPFDQLADVTHTFESLFEEGGLKEPSSEGKLDLLDQLCNIFLTLSKL